MQLIAQDKIFNSISNVTT